MNETFTDVCLKGLKLFQKFLFLLSCYSSVLEIKTSGYHDFARMLSNTVSMRILYFLKSCMHSGPVLYLSVAVWCDRCCCWCPPGESPWTRESLGLDYRLLHTTWWQFEFSPQLSAVAPCRWLGSHEAPGLLWQWKRQTYCVHFSFRFWVQVLHWCWLPSLLNSCAIVSVLLSPSYLQNLDQLQFQVWTLSALSINCLSLSKLKSQLLH